MPRVVLVDTESHIATLLKSRFEQEGFEVVSLGLAQGQRIADERPDLIICGRHKNDDHDLETFKDLLELGGIRAVPIIMLTASDVQSSEQPTDISQLKMPFRPSQLLELARKSVASA